MSPMKQHVTATVLRSVLDLGLIRIQSDILEAFALPLFYKAKFLRRGAVLAVTVNLFGPPDTSWNYTNSIRTVSALGGEIVDPRHSHCGAHTP
jgi:hypothetical protein